MKKEKQIPKWFAEEKPHTKGGGYWHIITPDFELSGFTGKENAQLIASAPELKQRVEDLERTISNFITHLEEFNGNYQPEELKKLRDSIAVERPYYSPVSYHDNWTGKEVTNEKD